VHDVPPKVGALLSLAALPSHCGV